MLFEFASEPTSMYFDSSRAFITQFQEAMTTSGYNCALFPVQEGTAIQILGSAIFNGVDVFFQGVRPCCTDSEMELVFTAAGKSLKAFLSIFSDCRTILHNMKNTMEALVCH
jgi:hypothetical protein